MANIIPNDQLKKINFYWQNIFDFKPNDKDTESLVVPKTSFKNSSKISIYHINDKSFVETDENIFGKIADFVNSYYSYKPVYLKDFQNYFTTSIEKENSYYFSYLAKCKDVSDILGSNYYIRNLTNSDTKLLENFKKSYFRSELKENLPNIDLPITLGCFYNKELISAASLFYFKNDIADIKLITHPAFKDDIIISKAMIIDLGRVCFKKNKILQYRFSEDNDFSRKIAKSMGFSLHVLKENFKFK
ncbi:MULTISPECIES: hypothetical protein [Clostridium]|uniref:hypothetical protein n=1 Tax=Clostridium TaxID=1485 RepID=UPI00082623A4|nr:MULTISPECIES: hypothetical protein [Clostridium]PJI08090.1 hypothetical protein CUB90_09515 [Clostridium sp. CT7]